MAADCEAAGAPAGRVAPVIDRNRCEGKAACVRVCPFDVFRIDVLTRQQLGALTWRGRLKAWAHGGRQAVVINGGDCHACRLCVAACPEQAISLAALVAPQSAG